MIEHVARMADAGADEILLADTIGVGVRRARCAHSSPRRCWSRAAGRSDSTCTTPATPASAADAGIESGATLFDASNRRSLGGLLRFDRADQPNIATEDLVYLLDGLGVETGVDLEALISVSAWLAGVLGPGKYPASSQAGPFSATGWAPRAVTAVAFVGLGRMGRLMAPHLVAAGHEVRGFDSARRPSSSDVGASAKARPTAAGRRSRSRCCPRRTPCAR